MGAIAADLPQAEELSFGPDNGKGSAQAVDALAVVDVAQPMSQAKITTNWVPVR